MKEKKNEKKEKKLWLVFGIVLIAIILTGTVIYIFNYAEDEYYNEEMYDYDSWESYDDFYKEYSDYNKDFDLEERNYYRYEKDLFSIKYSDQIGEEHFLKKSDNSNLYEINRNELYIFLTNNTDLEVINAKIGIIFYDKDENIIDVDSKTIYNLEKNNQICEVMSINSERIEDVKIIVNAFENNRKKALIKDIKTEVLDKDKFTIKVTNESEYNISSLDGVVVFYDSENKIIESDEFNIYDTLRKNKSVEEQLILYSIKDINEYKYKIFINGVQL